MEITAYLGLGSNLDNPVQQVILACAHIDQINHVRITAKSSLYESAPMGPQDQPDYINAVVKIDTTLDAYDLLERLQDVEARQGRVRNSIQWGARTLDIDILLFDQLTINSDQLKIPHPGLYERAFVLYPLQEINPHLIIPGYGPIQDCIERCESRGLRKLGAMSLLATHKNDN